MWNIFGRREQQPQSPQFLPEAEEMERLGAPFRILPNEIMVMIGVDFGTVALMCGYTDSDENSLASTAACFLIVPVVAPGGIDVCRLWNGLTKNEQESRRHILRSLTSVTEAQKNRQYSFLSFPTLALFDEFKKSDHEDKIKYKNSDFVDRMKAMLLRFADVFLNAKGAPPETKSRAFESVRALIDRACLPENLAVNP